MRYYITILILAFPILLIAQKADFFSIDSLPTEGVVLNKNWKWHTGDNPEWAKLDFDDSSWESIDPTKDIMDLPQIQNGKIGWLRLKIKMDSSLLSQSCALQIWQVLASELYVDGHLLERFGKLDSNEIKANFVAFKFIGLPKSKTDLIIALRFAFQKSLPYIRYGSVSNHCFLSTVMPIESIEMSHFKFKDHMMFHSAQTGAFFILFILHLALFIFYPIQKSNLYFSGMSFFYAIVPLTWAIALVCLPVIQNVEFLMYCGVIRIFLYAIGNILLVVALYSIFNFKKDTIFWLSCVGIVLSVIIYFFNYEFGDQISGAGTKYITALTSIYIVRKSLLTKNQNAKIILIGLIVWIITVVIRNIIPNIFPHLHNTLPINLSVFIGIIGVPICLSWVLGRDFAHVNKNLEEKLKEVETLSDEKQQILISQKEMLENQVNERTSELNQSLIDLKATQAQLIKIETQHALEQERTRLARDMHDDISSGLSAINLLANYIKNTPLSTDTHLEIKHIAESSTELNQRIREIIWAVSSDSDNIEGLVHFLRRYVSEFGEMQHVDTQYNVSDNLPEMKLSNETKRNLFLCVKEALNNAAKYAKATLIEVSIDVKDRHLSLTIQDNGIGFDIVTALKNGGNGLKNMRERLKQVGGEVFITAERGCQVVLKLKI